MFKVLEGLLQGIELGVHCVLPGGAFVSHGQGIADS
jgi:hypothetical protein